MEHLPPSSIGPGGQDLTSNGTNHQRGLTETHLRKAMAEREQEKFENAKEVLEKAINGIPELKPYKGSLLIDNTRQGLRIQLTDQDGLAMFPSGSSAMYGYTRALIDLVTRVINKLPNKISISGNTDSTPYHDPSGYTNWELSADRALATRRALIAAGVAPDRILRVVGRADTDPLVKNDPKSPRNRRISITLLRQSDLNPPPSVPLNSLGPSSGAPAP
jgi:chemotaxis protein MotB